MRTSGTTWDVALALTGNKGQRYPIRCVNLPASISRALVERGFDRVTVELTEKGILLVPYASGGAPAPNHNETVELPF